MAVAFDAASSASGGATTLSWTHTPVGTPSSVIVGVSSQRTVSSITYGGTAMTSVGTILNVNNSSIYKLGNPLAGAQTVTVTFPTAGDNVGGAVTFTGSNTVTSTMTGTYASATGTSTAPSVNVTSATNELVIDTVVWDDPGAGTVGAGQTQRWQIGVGSIGAAGSTEPGAATVTMSWTSPNFAWAIGGVSVKAAGGAAAVPSSLMMTGMGI